MVWVTWRQHRGEAIVVFAVAAVLTTALLATGAEMHSAFDAQGVAGCLGTAPPPSCSGVTKSYEQQFSLQIALFQWLNLVPLALGIFVGAPLVAREIERCTHLLAWTQGVTRRRWMVSKLVLLVGATAVVATAFTLLLSWWLQPLVAINGGALRPSIFDLQGIVPIGYFVAALAIGTVAGTLLRRTVPAMGVAVVAFLVVRFGTIGLLRPNYMAPVTSSASVGSPSPFGSNGAWILDDRLTQASGQNLSGRFALEQLCPAGGESAKSALDACLQSHGVVETLTYQPADRYWAFQGIELAGFLLLSAGLLLLTVWWVRRRIS